MALPRTITKTSLKWPSQAILLSSKLPQRIPLLRALISKDLNPFLKPTLKMGLLFGTALAFFVGSWVRWSEVEEDLKGMTQSLQLYRSQVSMGHHIKSISSRLGDVPIRDKDVIQKWISAEAKALKLIVDQLLILPEVSSSYDGWVQRTIRVNLTTQNDRDIYQLIYRIIAKGPFLTSFRIIKLKKEFPLHIKGEIEFLWMYTPIREKGA